jgi:hypothetical protein
MYLLRLDIAAIDSNAFYAYSSHPTRSLGKVVFGEVSSVRVMVMPTSSFFSVGKKKKSGEVSRVGMISWTEFFTRVACTNYTAWTGTLSQCRNHSSVTRWGLFCRRAFINLCRAPTMK